MRILPLITFGLMSVIPQTLWAQTEPNCELLVMEPVLEAGKPTGQKMAAYYPADQFLDSVYDDKVGFIRKVNKMPIKGVMCKRYFLTPTLRDFQIIATGIPLAISEDFDRADSSLVTLYFADGIFQYSHSGRDLTASQQSRFNDVVGAYNLQSHDLGK